MTCRTNVLDLGFKARASTSRRNNAQISMLLITDLFVRKFGGVRLATGLREFIVSRGLIYQRGPINNVQLEQQEPESSFGAYCVQSVAQKVEIL